MYLPVTHQSFRLLYHRPKIVTLIYIVHVKAIFFHILNEILCGISVVADHKREYLILLNERSEPIKAIFIVHEVLAGFFKQSSRNIGVIWKRISCRGLVYLLGRQKELAEHIKLSVSLNNHTTACQVRCLRQIYAADTVAIAEIFKFKLFAGCLLDNI